jgi:hypothetical protein
VKNSVTTYQPGVWSTDDYIRSWARKNGAKGECLVPLQSLHEFWLAKVHLNKPGQPVERIKKSDMDHVQCKGFSFAEA